ncbi:hypothetical protein A2382_00555 [Candidatus Woesebacteria bacterium RIFOXYB1_FULL_38_16]|uniref:Glycosyltransferase RgtA/B/C/D-like domain-containing protein n=1 Tax=Candidatus Woesebacteria bacterium RIFOXYB1_FULL_38_16 TaxID=1802538 RepID=A0A1F8CSM6_9BACT|nr:MAG: hypothetical protein A2191_01435 [Candidatus Woesebacteria bacterium RIFOXYA1_FULL_38_9]OGM79261.1 MAG: hypothetical protein A2382_00555 [Candidatus Woesebacteria bacterium RIFOXYB1_FULL_38_16]
MKISKIIKQYGLLLILGLALVVRLYKIDVIPPHLTSDEAALGYNAYSVLKTGRDEYGSLFPIIFKSFGDYKPGLYVYFTVPTVGIFGLNEFSVRLVSVLAGVLAVFVLYEIVKRLTQNSNLALIASFVLSLNPWHIFFSRGAWEVNLSLTLTLLGILFFLFSLKKEKWLLVSAIFFGSTFVCYQGAKLSTLIVLVILFCIYRREIFQFKSKVMLISLFIGFLITLPIISSVFQGKVGRLSVFSVFSYPREDESLNHFLQEAGVSRDSLVYRIYYSESLNFFRGILGRWFNHFSLRFLFFEGDWQNLRHSAPYHGVMLLGDIVFLVTGIWVLIRRKIGKFEQLVFGWLVLSSLPAVLSRDQVQAVRAYNMLIPLVIIVALGVNQFLKYRWSKLMLAVLYLGGLVYFFESYFIQMPYLRSRDWNYGYKQIVEYITPIQDDYNEVRIQQSFAQPYIYFLFYQKYDPSEYQKTATLVDSEYKFDVGKVEELGDRIKFVNITWENERANPRNLVVADTVMAPVENVPVDDYTVLKEIKYLDRIYTAFRIMEIK